MAKPSWEMDNAKKSMWSKISESVFGIFSENVTTGKRQQPKSAMFTGNGGGRYQFIAALPFDGEKNFGEMGPPKEYYIDYNVLRARSWAVLLESELAQMVIGKFISWVIGKGLKLQSEPVKLILKSYGINLNVDDYSKNLEARFDVYSASKMSSYSNMNSLNQLEATAKKNALVGGDVLVILRVIEGYPKVELIDGEHVVSPMSGSDWYPYALANGNRIIHGIEIAPSGEHVAYYVRKQTEYGYNNFEVERIRARGKKTGLLMAYMYYGLRYRIDNHRGLPLLSVVMEKIKQMDRYQSATLGSAEERQKIPFTIEHNYPNSTGENPFLRETAIALGSAVEGIPTDDLGNQLEKRVAATTNKNVYNLPVGAAMKAIESKGELYYKDFFEVNIKTLCASIKIPMDVAMSSYNNSFSASRAALKDWENTLIVERADDSFQFIQPILDLFLHLDIIQNRIQAPGYLKAFNDGDVFLLEVYRKGRFVGSPVPHIDPEKEVNAERLKLGATAANIPLTTIEAATENLNGGDSSANMSQYAKELEESQALDIKLPEPVLDPNTVYKTDQKKKQEKKNSNKKGA